MSSIQDLESTPPISKQFSCIRNLCKKHFETPLTITQYRILYCDSFAKKEKLISDSTTEVEKINNLVPLLLYNLKCNLSFGHLLEKIDLDDLGIKSPNELFHLLFQNSNSLLKSLLIHNFSFSNPIPFYFPLIYSDTYVKFALCEELWYSLTPHNAVISFGLGSAARQAMGKSKLLDLIFELNLEESNPLSSCFHAGSIDLRLTSNFFPGEQCEKYFTDWAFFDCNTPTPFKMVNLLLKHINIVIIHVLESDLTNQLGEITAEIESMELTDKQVFILVRDTNETSQEKTIFDEKLYTQMNIPALNGDKIKINRSKERLKGFGNKIIHSGDKIPKFTSKNLEELLKSYNKSFWDKIEYKHKLLKHIQDNISENSSNKGINFEFLNYYPIFIELMEKKHQLACEEEQDKAEKINLECTDCFERLENTKMCSTNEVFNEIIQDEDSILILWKLTQDLQELSSCVTIPNNHEQANDNYSIEILWREAILSHKYSNQSLCLKKKYYENLCRSMCNIVERGEPFELVDGDNLVFFSKELNGMLRHFHVWQTNFVKSYNDPITNPEEKISEAPIVLSIIGPQSSGKSTLLNYVFGCKFLTGSGRCTRGVYGSMMELSEPINNSKFFFLLDTEGIDAVERKNISNASNIHFDRSIILFCLSVSNIVIINLPGEITTNMQELLKICAFSLNQLKVKRTTLPKIIFVLNKTADPDLKRRKIALDSLVKSLNKQITDPQDNELVKIADLIKLSEEDLFTLPSAFDIASVDSPNYEIFGKEVIKQTPTPTFALKCSKLKLAIFERLRFVPHNDRPAFTSLSEWFDMAGGTWNAIITFQDIVKFQNLKEFHQNQELKIVIENIMEDYFYSNKNEFNSKIDEYSNEICGSISLTSAELKDLINRKTEDFLKIFKSKKVDANNEYSKQVSKLGETNLIQREFRDNLERLISTEMVNFRIILKNRTAEVFIQRRRLESFEEFKKEITSDPEKFLNFSPQDLKNEFERLWVEMYEKDDLEEIYRRENLTDFFSSFSNEWKLINRKDILEIYSKHNYDSGRVTSYLLTNIICGLTKTEEKEEQYFFPAKMSPKLKDIQPHCFSAELEYLNESDFYYVHTTEGQDSEFQKTFPNNKVIYKEKWVPHECVPQLRACSGYYSDYDINWGRMSPCNQMVKVVKYFMRFKDKTSSPQFVKDLLRDSNKLINKDPAISPTSIKLLAKVIRERISIFNHELSHIGAQLSIFANRDLGTYIFSVAFKSYYEQKWQQYLKNREENMKEKENLKTYSITKVEISRIIRNNKDALVSSDYDSLGSGEYGRAFMQLLTGRAEQVLPGCTEEKLKNKREQFEYKSISAEATDLVQEVIDKGSDCDRKQKDFLVQYYCERNRALFTIFGKKWEEFIELNQDEIITEVVTKQQNDADVLIKQLDNILKQLEGNKLDAMHLFKCSSDQQGKNIDSFQLNESPFRALTFFMCKLMDPAYDSENMKNLFKKEFICDGIIMLISSDFILNDKILNCFKISTSLFALLKLTNMFESELTFNLYKYLFNFKQTLEQRKISISNSRFNSLVKLNCKDTLCAHSVGCNKRCPCCRKFCELKLHSYGSCSTFGHQFASMGGKAWINDKEHSALFLRCEDYTDDMVVALPGRLTKWGDFKDSSCSEWNWNQDFKNIISDEEKEKLKCKLIKIWNIFGRDIIEYHERNSNTKITFRPYEEGNLSLFAQIDKFQICFVIDGTGSMAKDIEKVRTSVQSLVNSYKRSNKLIEFRIVIYRDHCDDENVLEQCPPNSSFTTIEGDVIQFLGNVGTYGGGDVPEAALDGLATGISADWEINDMTRRIVIHLFDAPPHGDFPNYWLHNHNSNPDYCCCCRVLCKYDWKRDVWSRFREEEVEYHGINTGDQKWTGFESVMSQELDYLCKGFTKCGKELVNDAVMQIFINYLPT